MLPIMLVMWTALLHGDTEHTEVHVGEAGEIHIAWKTLIAIAIGSPVQVSKTRLKFRRSLTSSRNIQFFA
jgi:hypothetical protein